METHNASKLGSILRSPQGEQYSAQKKIHNNRRFCSTSVRNVRRLRLLAHPQAEHLVRTVRCESANAGGYRGWRKELISLSTLDRVAEALNVAFSDLIKNRARLTRVASTKWPGRVRRREQSRPAVQSHRHPRSRIVGMDPGAGRGIPLPGRCRRLERTAFTYSKAV